MSQLDVDSVVKYDYRFDKLIERTIVLYSEEEVHDVIPKMTIVEKLFLVPLPPDRGEEGISR